MENIVAMGRGRTVRPCFPWRVLRFKPTASNAN
jgi:hypothetical protein